jgi:hypothetical protein
MPHWKDKYVKQFKQFATAICFTLYTYTFCSKQKLNLKARFRLEYKLTDIPSASFFCVSSSIIIIIYIFSYITLLLTIINASDATFHVNLLRNMRIVGVVRV